MKGKKMTIILIGIVITVLVVSAVLGAVQAILNVREEQKKDR